MKTIKINYIGFWKSFNKEKNTFSDILSEKFDVRLSDDPDFVFISPLGEPLEFLKYDCVRILYAGEPLFPDFNIFDYAIAFDRLSFPDVLIGQRYYRYPLCFYNYERSKQFIKGMSYEEARKILASKKSFCNFIYGHRSPKGERERILSEIEKYKHIDSAGSFLNNMPDGRIVPYTSEKFDFLRPYKFTIACESVSYPGFVTEKIRDPFYSNSIPIYYGDPNISEEFNSEAFVNLHLYSSIEEGVKRIIEIDQNDELYINMLMKQKTVSDHYFEELYLGLKNFLFSIFSQDPDRAYRRLRSYPQKDHESYLDEYRRYHKKLWYRAFKKIDRINGKFKKNKNS